MGLLEDGGALAADAEATRTDDAERIDRARPARRRPDRHRSRATPRPGVCGSIHPRIIVSVVRRSRHELDSPSAGALPELLERLARQRLLQHAAEN
jgi:hypothetical protein